MKSYHILLILLLLASISVSAQQRITGKVNAFSDSIPIEGAIISQKETNITTVTNKNGYFTISVPDTTFAFLLIDHVGYESTKVTVKLPQRDTLNIFLSESVRSLEEIEIVSTGYQKIPKERATGSFSTISNELFNQQIGTDILSRLPAIANSVVMDKGRQGTPQMMVRGLSTIRGPKDPLIVVDNFPYEGDITNINPNIVESVTVLKDASASSIWGAQAANGVIVITTKTGQFNQRTSLEFASNLTIESKPDLGYIRQMSSSDFIDIEQELFSQNFYNSQINSANRPIISPVVDLLNKTRAGELTEEEAQRQINSLRSIDVRDQFNQYMYKPSFNQQYFLHANGGVDKFSWSSSVGYDHNEDNLKAAYDRLNIHFQNIYQAFEKLSLTTRIYYTQTQNTSGRSGYNDIGMKANSFVPYMRMVDDKGNALAVPKNWNQSFIETAGDGKLLDWNYYPLTDWKHQSSQANNSDILATVILNYKIINGLSGTINYQYERESGSNSNLAGQDSYMARNYINSFAQIIDGEVDFIVPEGGILDKSNRMLTANNLRGQLSFDNTFGKHGITAIIGTEVRTTNNMSSQERFYGYDLNNLSIGHVDYTHTYPGFVNGGSTFIQNNQQLRETATRFISQYANAAYIFDNRYIFSASGRRDASNLFGLKTNKQWNPFWSAGITWRLSNEEFYNIDFLPFLNLRVTNGFSGNIDPSMVAVNTMAYQSNVSILTGLPIAQINNYYNPNLKWETSKMFNIAMDFRSKNDRLVGSIEYYHKKGRNLFGVAPLDFTLGIPPTTLRNVASMQGKGWDIELKSHNINRDFKWTTILNFSLYRDKIEDYLISRTVARDYISTSNVPVSGIKGHPVYAIYAYKWAGLDPQTGEAQGYLDGEISKNYSTITGTGTKIEELEYFGSAIPTKFGSFVNSLSYKDFGLQIGLTFKFGYWLRKSSINYTSLFNGWIGHSDYEKRWQQPGDELITNVPANPFSVNTQRDAFYAGSSVLVDKADHLRLQYINLVYDLSLPAKKTSIINNLQVILNINNVGLLWKSNDSDIDPDFNIGSGYRTVIPTSYALGIRTKF